MAAEITRAWHKPVTLRDAKEDAPESSRGVTGHQAPGSPGPRQHLEPPRLGYRSHACFS